MSEIRKATYDDLDKIAEIFSCARRKMAENGNPTQWGNDRPSMDLVKNDIDHENFYVITENGKIGGVFAFIIGIEPTYLEIDGEWLDNAPYGTIHRIASDGTIRNIFGRALFFAEKHGVDIRIDTHKDNKIMLHQIEKNGFSRCGIIIVDDGTKRIAFQKKNGRNQKVLVIAGPTAVGKTEFGIRCAKLFNGEIISGDSIQIYRKLDIGSAKPNKKELQEAKHHLIDIKEADENYSVKEFQERCRSCIAQIADQNKLPIIVGGTGLYIKAAMYDYCFFEETEEDDPYEKFSNEELYSLLAQKDPKALEKIHINNRRRLVRALNVYEKHEKGISAIKEEQEHAPVYDCLIIGLTTDRKELFERIDRRVDKMMENGLLNEIEDLLKKGIDFSKQSMQGIGYKEFKEYFEENKTLEECVKAVKINSRHFAKRQYTFFKNQLDVKWFEDKEEALKEIEKWLT